MKITMFSKLICHACDSYNNKTSQTARNNKKIMTFLSSSSLGLTSLNMA